ncbi:IPExxxVDY family protein [Chryseobacterium sp. cx-311]|uniref:IPExxxVDY family protein n=1 Tax=Marnyiella aurantia TaxID=2758037 RepID=UPI001AE4E9E5|nr:IPExxxVDY family protein [Marnyiella aurantia]MBP0613544.1 IPExxxVDY family protein [Marnyiella aurantia]
MDLLKLTLDDCDEDDGVIALVRLVKKIPDHEFFFHINYANSFCFERIDDLVVEGTFYTYHFSVFRGYSKESRTCFRFISNKSIFSIKNRELTELFSGEGEVKYLLEAYPDTDYILTSPDKCADFSLILLPENLCFQLQEIPLGFDERLFHTLQYYE